VLSHKDIILNRSLSQLSPHENHLEYHIVSTLTQRRTRQHIDSTHTPITWAHPTTRGRLNSSHRGERCPNHWGTTQLSHRGERSPITWACPTLGSLTGQLNSVTEENVSWRMSHDVAIINKKKFHNLMEMRPKQSTKRT
jgi:hypothetical protein